MREDFGFGGDEFLIGDCMDDWQQATQEFWQERMDDDWDGDIDLMGDDWEDEQEFNLEDEIMRQIDEEEEEIEDYMQYCNRIAEDDDLWGEW